MFKKIEKIILSKSNSYNFYKNQYEKYIKNQKNSIPQIEKEYNQLKKDFDEFKNNIYNHMDSTTYLLNNIYVDHEINQPRNILNLIQSLTFELLIFISNISNEHELKFWLDYGSLLGAVRHGNFVPWDDDIDIGMMRSHYIKFNEIIQDEIKNNDLDDMITVEKDSNSFIQIHVKNKNQDILSRINIFPYDYLLDYDEKTFKDSYNNSKSTVNIENNLEQYYNSLNLSFESCDFIIPGIDGNCGSDDYYNIFILKNEDIFPLIKIKFGSNSFYAPKNFNYYLKQIYNDYLNIPRIIPRHNYVEDFKYNYDNEKVFGECINKLKVINDK